MDDGGSGKISLFQPFPFFGKRHDNIYVNNNGIITFLQELKTYRPESFPLKDDTPIIAPYWADVNVEVGGIVWYREILNTPGPNSDILRLVEEDVRGYSSSYSKFKPNWTFISTWDNVGYYGAIQEGKNKRNSFQCVLVSDGVQSFVIIRYKQIEWTTGSNSHGAPETGLGGNPAQAGFNAGDRINFYVIDGAGNDSVINLTRTSNVCSPGTWIFKVHSAEIQPDSGELDIIPKSGSMLGGYEVNISGPCFESTSRVQGLIIETNTTFTCVKSVEVGSRTVHCVMPTVFAVGQRNVTILVDGNRWNYTGAFTFVNPGLVPAHVTRHSPENWRADAGTVEVSWKSSLFAGYDTVTVEVMEYTDAIGEPHLIPNGTSMSAVNNDKRIKLKLPPLQNATLAVIRVKVEHILINGSFLSHWSDVFPVRWKGTAASESWCSVWLSDEHSHADLTQPAACPCTLKQAESDTGRWQKDPLCSSGSEELYNCVYRGKKAHECIVPTYKGSEMVNQHCCYGHDLELLDIRERGGGSLLDRYHFRSHGNLVVPWFSYLEEDVVPYLQCCEHALNTTLCDLFTHKRPPVSCQGYSPPTAAQAAGDPHIVTLDGVNYTFNGVGDFILLQDITGRVKVHVHASRAVDIDDQLGNATVFTAVAMQVENETNLVEIKKGNSESIAVVLVNKVEVDLTSTQEELRGMTIYRNETNNGTIEFTVVMDTAGVSVLVSATNELLNIMVMVGSSELTGKLEGLLGNNNGKKDDDFKPRYRQPIPISSNLTDIHYNFGMTWLVSKNESLLTVPAVPSDNIYVPVFTIGEENLRNGTRELCNGNLQCMFDYQLTGKKEIAESTKEFSQRYEDIKTDIKPVVRCPYVEQIVNGNRTMEGQAPGNKATFKCDDNFTNPNNTYFIICQETGEWNSAAPVCVKKLTDPEMNLPLLAIYLGGGLGGFVFVTVIAFLIFMATKKLSRKFVPKGTNDSGSEPETGFELPVIFPPSEQPNAVFENPHFLTSLQKLMRDEGRFQIPRPRYVDPNIYTEYF